MDGNGIKELKTWIERNKEQFKGYAVDDIAHLAIACGFDRQAVAQWQVGERFKQAI